MKHAPLFLASAILWVSAAAIPVGCVEAVAATSQPFLRLPEGPSPGGDRAGRAMVAGNDKAAIQLQWIPPGTFAMGDARDGPVTMVHLTRGFWIGRYEVTQALWAAVMGNHPSQFKFVGLDGSVEDAPVENVSWFDAMNFCRKINEREAKADRLPAGYEFRLPTEAEWEYACRAGSTGDPGGDRALDEVAWHYGWDGGNSGGYTHPVGRKKPNAWGLYDMLGNVFEWCADWYGPYPGNQVTDPVGPKLGVDRVNRGGCFDTLVEDCRSASRNGVNPGERIFTIGFRVALGPRLP